MRLWFVEALAHMKPEGGTFDHWKQYFPSVASQDLQPVSPVFSPYISY